MTNTEFILSLFPNNLWQPIDNRLVWINESIVSSDGGHCFDVLTLRKAQMQRVNVQVRDGTDKILAHMYMYLHCNAYKPYIDYTTISNSLRPKIYKHRWGSNRRNTFRSAQYINFVTIIFILYFFWSRFKK